MEQTEAEITIGARSRPPMQSWKRNLSFPPFSGYRTVLPDFIPTETATSVSEMLPTGHSSWKDATGNCSSLFVLILNILNWLPGALPLPTAFPCCCVLPPSSLDPYVVLDMPDSSWRGIFGQALRSSTLTKNNN